MKLAVLWILLFALPGLLGAQAKETRPPKEEPKIPAVVSEFLNARQKGEPPEVFFSRAKESLWSVYPHDDSLKNELAEYVRSGLDGPGIGFAAIALIPFHEPSTARVLLDRAIDRQTSPPTRFCLLNAAPYILAIGDGIYTGEGKLDGEARRIARELTGFAEVASRQGLGKAHASVLRRLFETRKPERHFVSALMTERPYGLVEQHFSAYLIGTLDLADRETLAPLIAPETYALPNLMKALSFSANREFEKEILAASPEQITPEFLRKHAGRALEWWKGYLAEHPSGDWLPAVLQGFREAGFQIEEDPRSTESLAVLLRAMDAESKIIRFNVYRLLNRIFQTNFDLERIFQSDKYALSFLEPNNEKGVSEQRLKAYWKKRLTDLINKSG